MVWESTVHGIALGLIVLHSTLVTPRTPHEINPSGRFKLSNRWELPSEVGNIISI